MQGVSYKKHVGFCSIHAHERGRTLVDKHEVHDGIEAGASHLGGFQEVIPLRVLSG